jgi:hypothetical protein
MAAGSKEPSRATAAALLRQLARLRAAPRRSLGCAPTAAAAEPKFLCHRRASRRIGRRCDRVVCRQLPVGVIRREIEAMRDPQMTPERLAAKPAFEADHYSGCTDRRIGTAGLRGSFGAGALPRLLND